MATLHGKEIKVGDKVWDVRRGWVLVGHIAEKTGYSISLGDNAYTDTGRLYFSDPNPSIYWEEMILTPKPESVYEWQWLYWDIDDEIYRVVFDFFKSETEALEDLSIRARSRPLIRIEESKREVKP